MNDFEVRPRGVKTKVKNKSNSEKGILNNKKSFIIRLVIALLIFMFLVIMKNTDEPYAKDITEKVKGIFLKTTDVNSTFSSVEAMVMKGLESEQGIRQSEEKQKQQGSQKEEVIVSKQKKKEKKYEKAVSSSISYVKPTPTPSPTPKPEKFQLPVSGQITSEFATYRTTSSNKKHSGVDIAANSGTGIKSSKSGKVIEVGYNSIYGNYIKVKHDDTYTTLYAHCSKIIAEEGANVKQGEIIALVGSTGYSTGPHVHFEIRVNGNVQDPLKYV